MKEKAFLHLHVRSNFSPDGLSSIEDIVERAKLLQMKSIALTDLNTLAGAVRFTKKANDLGIKPIIGADLSVLPFKHKNFSSRLYSLTFLVETDEGYRNLVSLINLSLQNKGVSQGQPYITIEDLRVRSGGLIVLCGGNDGELTEFLRAKKPQEVEEYITLLKSVVRENCLFIELLTASINDYSRLNKFYEHIAGMFNLNTVVTNNVRFLNYEDELPALFLTEKEINPEDTADMYINQDCFNQYLCPAAEIMEIYQEHPKAVEYTELIADRCTFSFPLQKRTYPKHDFVRGQDADSYLWNLMVEKLEQKYGNVSDPKINKRLNSELEYIKNNKLSDFMVLLAKIADFLQKNGVQTGIGRGVLLQSVVAYLAGITNIDPIFRQAMNFQEFSDPETYPQLTLEIPTSQIDKVIEFIKSLYQEKFICFAGNYSCPSRQNILSMILTKLNIPELSRTSYYKDEVLDTVLANNETIENFLGDAISTLSIKDPKVVSFILGKLIKTQMELNQNENQIAISADNFENIAPGEKEDPESLYSVSQFDHQSLIDCGVAVITLKTERILDSINYALKLISTDPLKPFDINQIPFNDKVTYELLSEGETTGVHFFDTITVKTILRQEKPASLDQLRKVIVKAHANISPKENFFNESEFLNSIVETDIGYKCAYLKARFPSAFFTALISINVRIKDISVYLREAARIGIIIKPPDILTSDFDFKQDQKGIRMGLSIIPGFDKTAFEELKRLRKGFPYNNLADLITNTDKSQLSLSQIKKLIQCGAFDSLLNTSRGEMLAEFNRIAERIKISEDEDGAAGYDKVSQIPSGHDDDPEMLINWEINSVRFPMTVDQIEINKKFLDRIYAEQPEKISPRLNNTVKTFVGYINSFDREGPFINTKTEYVLDFEGYMVHAAPSVIKQNIYAIQTTVPVVILGKIVASETEVHIRAITINTLTVIKYSAENAGQILIDLAGENEETLKMIYKALKRFKGKTPVVPMNFENDRKRIFRKIKEMNVLLCPLLTHHLHEILSPEKIQLR